MDNDQRDSKLAKDRTFVTWGIIPIVGFFGLLVSLMIFWNGNSFFDKFYKVQNFFPYAIPIV
ncbi:hypothetical protein H318_13828, partial [Enterococcus durans IPLA 655]